MQIRILEPVATNPSEPLNQAVKIWAAGVEWVRGETATRYALTGDGQRSWPAILAVGKAASSMMAGALDALDDNGRALVITKYHHLDDVVANDPRIATIESGHPLPDQNSLEAGRTAIQFVENLAPSSDLLVLVSGGASALVESLVEGFDLEQLGEFTGRLLAEGYSIDQMNALRVGISEIKGGKLLRRFKGGKIQVYALSDIPGDDPNLIGSGIAAIDPPRVEAFTISESVKSLLPGPVINPDSSGPDSSKPGFDFSLRMIGTNQLARDAAGAAAVELGLKVIESSESLSGDVAGLARQLGEKLASAEPGVYLWGGEPTVTLPAKPGKGGRNQSLAVALALECNARGCNDFYAVVAGTDGTDGPTDAAGGVVYPGISLAGAKQALDAADAEPWLRQAGCLLVSGPTGTNVMDLAVVIVGER